MTERADRVERARLGRFRRYPDHRESGVGWLGKIPAHWDMKRLKFVSHTVAGQSPPSAAVADGTDGLPFLQGNAEFGSMNPTPHQVCDSAPKRAEPGDILLSVRAPVGAMNMADRAYGIGRGLCAIRPRAGLDRLFSFYQVMAIRPLLDAVATGSTYDAVTASDVGDLPVLLPHREEQRAIAGFLDHETARIDAMVARKQRLIELFEEKRTALITRAVTRGLDPNVPMKDSGIERLRVIPAHWGVRRLKDRGVLVGGAGFPPDYQGATDEALPFYKVGDLSASSDGRYMGKAPHTVSFKTASELRAHVIPENSIIYAKIGAALLLNRRRITTVPCCIDNNMSAYVPRRGVASGWAFHWMTAVDFAALVRPGAVPSLSEGEQANIPIVIPPMAEQHAIVAFLHKQITTIDALITRIHQAINHLRELRTALISAAVTGKIDVRKEAA